MAPTELYIVRHGIAEDENPEHPGSDHWRRLTDRGRDRMAEAAAGMSRLGVAPDAIWTSPHVRAKETAEILLASLQPPGGLIEEPALSFDGSPGETVERVADAGVGALMLVGHNPMLSDLVSELVGGGRLRIRLKKGSLVHVRLWPLPRGLVGELMVYMPPRALRAAGGE